MAMELFRGKGRLTWQLRFTDHLGARRQLSTRTSDRSSALGISQKIESLIGYLVRDNDLPPDLARWIQLRHVSIREKLVAWQMTQATATEAIRPLVNPSRPEPLPSNWKDPPPALVDMWEQDLEEREVTGEYAALSAQRMRILLALEVPNHPPIRYIGDVTAEGLLARVRELRRTGSPPGKGKKRRPLSPQTCEHYMGKAREFFAWLISKGIATSNPAAGLIAYSPEVIAQNKSRDRRALTRDEQVLLITGTATLAQRWNMTGAERALLYRFALRTGLRANEVRTLRVANFNFFAKTFVVLAADAKASRTDTLPIAPELVEPLRLHFQGKLPQAAAFTSLCEDNYCKMLQDDLADLGIPYRDHLGRYADFHALRHTYGTELARLVLPAVHQKLMRHADIETTMRFYTHLEETDKAEAVAKLPALMEAADHKKAGGAA